MTVTTPTIWYANYGDGSTTGYFAVGTWVANTAKTVGQFIRATAPTVGNERVFVCIVAGTTSNPTQPTWVNTKGAKTTDTGVTWMECTGNPALNGDNTNTPLSSQNRSGAQVLGNIIQNNTQDHYFICTSAGTTGAGEPTYSTSTGATTVDSGCTWTCLGAVSSFTTAWAAPWSRLANITNSWLPVNTGTLYVSSSHAETQAASMTLGPGTSGAGNTPVNVICIQNAGSIPPGAANITTGATVTTTGSNSLSLTGCVAYNGIAFSCGTTGSVSSLTIGNAVSATFVRIRNGSLSLPTSGGANIIFVSSVELYNTTVAFGSSSSQAIQFSSSTVVWRDTPSALSATTWPTTLFAILGSASVGPVLLENVDLSAFAGTSVFTNSGLLLGRVVFSHCKLPSTLMDGNSTSQLMADGVLDIINSDTGGNTYNTERHGVGGVQTTTTTVVATGGASDGTTSYAWKIVSANPLNTTWTAAFECIPIAIWNTTITPSNPTVTLQGAYVGTSLPNNDDIWFDVVYFGTSGSTLGTRATSTKATILTASTPWSSSSTLWGSAAAARQNSHAYVLGDAIGVSSGGSIVRAFVCTTAGTSNGSLPGAYGSAVDGTQVTDNTAVFTAVERFSMALTLSAPKPQAAGYLMIYLKLAKPTSTFFVDPSVALT